jgi:hypothetical protein
VGTLHGGRAAQEQRDREEDIQVILKAIDTELSNTNSMFRLARQSGS